MKRKLIVLAAVVTLCKTFCFDDCYPDNVAKVNEEINAWLVGKKVRSTISDSQGGYGFGCRKTCITIIAEVEEK